jgi:hypothetical protein
MVALAVPHAVLLLVSRARTLSSFFFLLLELSFEVDANAF